VQRITPENMQGRLMGAVESLGAIFPAFGYVLGSVITIAASPRIALLVAGVGVSICTIAFLRIPLDAKDADPHSADGLLVDASEPSERLERTWTHPPDEVSAHVDILPGAGAEPASETREHSRTPG
jgi:hypothetical protein